MYYVKLKGVTHDLTFGEDFRNLGPPTEKKGVKVDRVTG